MDDRVRSRLQTATRIRFDAFDQEALVAILEDRARWGLRADAITTEQLERIADAAAGDARVAIEILRGAAREAVHDGAETISDAHIDETIPHAKAEIKRKHIEKLAPDQQVLYEIIADHVEIAPSDLYTAYREQVDDPKTERTVRNYLQKLQHYNLITAEGDGRGRMYKVLSETE